MFMQWYQLTFPHGLWDIAILCAAGYAGWFAYGLFIKGKGE